MFETVDAARAAVKEYVAEDDEGRYFSPEAKRRVAPKATEVVLESLVPVIGLRPGDPGTPTQPAELHVGATRLGGEPDLPETMEWPRPESPAESDAASDHGGTVLPFTFLAQIDLTEASALGEVAGVLPETGRLLFFHAMPAGFGEDGSRVARVIWDTTPPELLRTAVMPDDLAEAHREGRPGGERVGDLPWAATDFHGPARPGILLSALALPGEDSPELDQFLEAKNLGGDEIDIHNFFHGFYWLKDGGPLIDPDWHRRQLLGTPIPEQGDPREYLDAENITDWRLLLQIGLDNWDADSGDGTVYFLITNTDLEQHRFGNVKAVFQCT